MKKKFLIPSICVLAFTLMSFTGKGDKDNETSKFWGTTSSTYTTTDPSSGCVTTHTVYVSYAFWIAYETLDVPTSVKC